MNKQTALKFGDPITMIAAAEGNPLKYCHFVRRGNRTGRMNAGPYIECTDLKGKFWTTPVDNIARRDAIPLPDLTGADVGVELECPAEYAHPFFVYDFMPQKIMFKSERGDDTMALDVLSVRGWGHLIGHGQAGLKINEKAAAEIQDNFGKWVAKTLTAALSPVAEKGSAGAEVDANDHTMSGSLVFKSTRIMVSQVAGYINAGSTNTEILEAWPHLTDDQIEGVRAFLGRLSKPAESNALTDVPGNAEPSIQFVPDNCTGAAFIMEFATLNFNKDGSAYFVFGEDKIESGDDRGEGPAGPEGSVHWIARISADDINELRHLLNTGRFTPPAQSDEPVLWCNPQELRINIQYNRDRQMNVSVSQSSYFTDALYLRPAPAAVPEWRAIETAPKGDIVKVLGWVPCEKRGDLIEIVKLKDGKPFVIGSEFAFDRSPVTHWMPLPASPENGGE